MGVSRNIGLVVIVAVVGAASVAGCASGARNDVGSTEPIRASSATLVVHGMSCPLCANNVDKQLKEVPGVRDVSVDMASGQVKVSFADGAHPSEAQLRKAVDGSGFTLKSVSTP